jgi:hypothetical protein
MALETKSRTLHAWSLQDLARIRAAAGFPEEARRSLQQALSESTAMSEHLRTMLIRTDLAKLALDEPLHEPKDAAGRAAQLAGEAAAWFRERGNSWGEAEASAVLAQALARLGKRAEALAAVDRVRALTGKSEDRSLALCVAPRLALARMMAGEGDRALPDVAAAAGESRRLGFVIASLEARLVQGWIEMRRGDPEGRRRIEEVRKEAQARGLGRLVRRADEALSPAVQRPQLI